MHTDLHFRGIEYANVADCHLQLIRQVRTISESLSENLVRAHKGKAFNRHFWKQQNAFTPFTVEQKYQISGGTFPLTAKANAVVNFFGKCDGSCNSEHYSAIEWCTDNRVGIGANLLKHAYLAKKFGSDTAKYLGVVVAADASVISESGMSSAVASTDEYLIHHDEIYGSLIQSPLAFLNVKF